MMNEQINTAIIGGTGIYDPVLFNNTKQIKVYTPFGAPSDLITIGDYNGMRLAFLPRHGSNHQFPPHKVPYRANLWALKELGVKRIIAPAAVGSLCSAMEPGHLVVPDQFVDFTKKREYTFYDGGQIAHIAMHEPFCAELRALAIAAAQQLNIAVHDKGTNITIEGPRFSTRAESEFFRSVVKGNTIGMTLVPECILARELEICYVSIGAVTDYDTWADEPVNAPAVIKTMQKNASIIQQLLGELLSRIPQARGNACECADALKDVVI